MRAFTFNHPFIDGNKRTAWVSMKCFLEENNVWLKAETEEIVELLLRIEDKSFGVEQERLVTQRSFRRNNTE